MLEHLCVRHYFETCVDQRANASLFTCPHVEGPSLDALEASDIRQTVIGSAFLLMGEERASRPHLVELHTRCKGANPGWLHARHLTLHPSQVLELPPTLKSAQILRLKKFPSRFKGLSYEAINCRTWRELDCHEQESNLAQSGRQVGRPSQFDKEGKTEQQGYFATLRRCQGH